MGTNLMRAMLLTTASVAMVATAAPTAAYAQEATYQIDIPAQSLGDALRALGKATKQNIVFNGSLVKGRRSAAVRGRMSASAALEQMLQGSGLKMARGAGGGLVVQTGNGGGSSPQAEGSGVLIGNVRDNATGAALKGALIEAVGTGEKVSTGDLGDFRFSSLPNGEVTLRISYLGFPDQRETVSVVSGLTNRADILLGGGATQEIVVIGQVSARAQALNQERVAENSTTIISGDLLGNFNGTTVSDSLRRAPGISFLQNGLTGDGTNVVVRGLSPDYNQIKLNGVNLPEGSGVGRSANLSNLLSDSISEIRISKTLLASQDSSGTGGLIEIETKSPLDRPKRYFNVSVDGTQRGKGFGQDYMASGTASFRFGAEGNFGVSASFQYRDQSVSSYEYQIQGVPGAYLPLRADGQPASFQDLDPRTPFPFYEGGQYYTQFSSASRNISDSTTSNLSLSAEWQPGPGTNLRLDYVRSRREATTLQTSYQAASGFGTYQFLQPVPAEGGNLRYVFGTNDNSLYGAVGAFYNAGAEDNTDTVSFRGTSAIGALSLDFRAGYSKASSIAPFNAQMSFSDYVSDIRPYLTPEATDPATGTFVTLFGPRTDRGLPVPFLTQAGYDALRNSPPAKFGGLTTNLDNNGKSTNLTARIDGKYEFRNSFVKYLEAGVDFKRTTFDSPTSHLITYNPIYDETGQTVPIPNLGLQYGDVSFGPVTGGNTVYRFITRDSLLKFLNDRDSLIDQGYATLDDIPPNLALATEATTENAVALFIQGRMELGKLEIIPGLRIDRNKVDTTYLNAVAIFDENFIRDEAYFEESQVATRASDTLTSYLPRILLNYRPVQNVVLRAGYYSTVARPSVRQLNSQRTISLYQRPVFGPSGTQPALYINEGNPALKPARTHNFDIGAEWYDGKVGVIKVNAFVKTITNLIEYNSINLVNDMEDLDLPDHPAFQNLPSNIYIEYSIPMNNSKAATLWGFEISAERRLSFLPGFLSGLGIYANYTYGKSKKVQSFNWSKPIYDASGVLTNYEMVTYQRILPFDQSPRHSGTAGLTYTRPGFDASLYYTAQARRFTSAQSFGLDSYEEAVNSLDFRGVYSFDLAGAKMRLSVEGLNLLKGKRDSNTDGSYGGADGVPKVYRQGYFLGGRSINVGLSASF